ncbi:MAG: aspartyl protease family protein [Gammaproteobacteria bacterium]|jgi:aspartyl protease family protein
MHDDQSNNDSPEPGDEPPVPAVEHRFGVTMIIMAWLLVASLLAIPLWSILEDKVNPNRGVTGTNLDDGAKEVTLRRNRQGHYLAPGAINGRPVSFMLDTGATVVAIPEVLARDIGLKLGAHITMKTANGLAQARRTTLSTVTLGTITLYDVLAVTYPGTVNDDVLLGMSFLRELNFTQRGRELTLRQTPN